MKGQTEIWMFEENDEGVMEETACGLRHRIGSRFGFDPDRVVLMESNPAQLDLAGVPHVLATWAAFAVNGIGYATDFSTLGLAPEYDDRGEEQK